jgi:hypothetical protein
MFFAPILLFTGFVSAKIHTPSNGLVTIDPNGKGVLPNALRGSIRATAFSQTEESDIWHWIGGCISFVVLSVVSLIFWLVIDWSESGPNKDRFGLKIICILAALICPISSIFSIILMVQKIRWWSLSHYSPNADPIHPFIQFMRLWTFCTAVLILLGVAVVAGYAASKGY